MMPIQKITVVDVNLKDGNRICGNRKGIKFNYGFFQDKQTELSWEEVRAACSEYVESRKERMVA